MLHYICLLTGCRPCSVIHLCNFPIHHSHNPPHVAYGIFDTYIFPFMLFPTYTASTFFPPRVIKYMPQLTIHLLFESMWMITDDRSGCVTVLAWCGRKKYLKTLKFWLGEKLIFRRYFGKFLQHWKDFKCFTILSGNSTLPRAKGVYIVPKLHCDKFWFIFSRQKVNVWQQTYFKPTVNDIRNALSGVTSAILTTNFGYERKNKTEIV